jgi:hypothetical protein
VSKYPAGLYIQLFLNRRFGGNDWILCWLSALPEWRIALLSLNLLWHVHLLISDYCDYLIPVLL